MMAMISVIIVNFFAPPLQTTAAKTFWLAQITTLTLAIVINQPH